MTLSGTFSVSRARDSSPNGLSARLLEEEPDSGGRHAVEVTFGDGQLQCVFILHVSSVSYLIYLSRDKR